LLIQVDALQVVLDPAGEGLAVLGGIHGHRRCGDCRDGLVQGASQATRDVADFADIGLEVIDPWDSP
jgi:hypothetical protein